MDMVGPILSQGLHQLFHGQKIRKNEIKMAMAITTITVLYLIRHGARRCRKGLCLLPRQ
jgi:hypothetical protein